MTKTIFRITKKGQVTVPKEIRTLLNSEVVEYEVNNGQVILKPVPSVAGALKEYAKEYIPFEKVRDETWEKVVREKYSS